MPFEAYLPHGFVHSHENRMFHELATTLAKAFGSGATPVYLLGNVCFSDKELDIRFIQPGEPLFALAGLWQKFDDGEKFTMLTTTPNASVSPYHHRMPFLLQPQQYADWLGDAWLQVLENPDKAPLEKIQKQPELF